MQPKRGQQPQRRGRAGVPEHSCVLGERHVALIQKANQRAGQQAPRQPVEGHAQSYPGDELGEPPRG
jgi:hypothetical protein